METAIIGFLGVIAGGVVTGGVQAITGYFDRRLSSRSAARLLYMNLHAARYAIEDLQRTRAWLPTVTDWNAFGLAWDQHCEALSRRLGTKDFLLVSSAFSVIGLLARGHARGVNEAAPLSGTPPGFEVSSETLQIYLGNVEAATGVILKAAFTQRELRRGEYPELG